jgi:hypothetical protein
MNIRITLMATNLFISLSNYQLSKERPYNMQIHAFIYDSLQLVLSIFIYLIKIGMSSVIAASKQIKIMNCTKHN